jgi:hypothetical protein
VHPLEFARALRWPPGRDQLSRPLIYQRREPVQGRVEQNLIQDRDQEDGRRQGPPPDVDLETRTYR